MSDQRVSRAEIVRGSRGSVAMHLICEKTKQIFPVYGLDKDGALALAKLLIEIGKAGGELPKEIVDQTLTTQGV